MCKEISCNASSMQTTFVCESWATDKATLPTYHGYGKNELANYYGRLGDNCIDMSTGANHWLTSTGWTE